jgi:hypothetical protein
MEQTIHNGQDTIVMTVNAEGKLHISVICVEDCGVELIEEV